MPYHLLVSRKQLERISAAVAYYERAMPLNPNELADPNLEFLNDTLAATLKEPESDDMLHGICL